MTGSSVQLFTQRDHVHECLVALHRMTTLSIADTMFGYDDAELDQLIRDKLDTAHVFVQHRPARRCGLILHCAGQPRIVIEHKTGGRTQDWYAPRRSVITKCRLLFLVEWEARLS